MATRQWPEKTKSLQLRRPRLYEGCPVSIHLEYLKNRSRGLDVTWQSELE